MAKKNMTPFNEEDGGLFLPSVPVSQTQDFDLGVNVPWVKDLLIELNENVVEKSPEDYLNETSISIKLELRKKHNHSIGEYLLIKGQVNADFITECVKTLMPMKDSVSLEFRSCYIDIQFESEPEYAELTEMYMDDDVYELYFYEKRRADIKEMLHEMIYLNIDQYPSMDKDNDMDLHQQPTDTKH